MRDNWLAALLAVLGIVIAAAAVTLLSAAPVPAKKPAKAKVAPPTVSVCGYWEMEWRDGKGMATFNFDGSYTCDGWGGAWEGKWRRDGDEMSVDEGQTRPNGPTVLTCQWTVNLVPGTRAGTLHDGGAFALRPPKPDF